MHPFVCFPANLVLFCTDSNFIVLKKTDVESVFNLFQDSEENKMLVYVSSSALTLCDLFCFCLIYMLSFFFQTEASFIPVARISARWGISDFCSSSETVHVLQLNEHLFLCFHPAAECFHFSCCWTIFKFLKRHSGPFE